MGLEPEECDLAFSKVCFMEQQSKNMLQGKHGQISFENTKHYIPPEILSAHVIILEAL